MKKRTKHTLVWSQKRPVEGVHDRDGAWEALTANLKRLKDEDKPATDEDKKAKIKAVQASLRHITGGNRDRDRSGNPPTKEGIGTKSPGRRHRPNQKNPFDSETYEW